MGCTGLDRHWHWRMLENGIELANRDRKGYVAASTNL